MKQQKSRQLLENSSHAFSNDDDPSKSFYFESGQRIVCLSDIDGLQSLENASWTPTLRHSKKAILAFIKKHPLSVFVQEDLNGNILGVIYTKPIRDTEKIDAEPWNKSNFHGHNVVVQGSSFLQLMRVNTIQKGGSNNAVGVGFQLRDLALRYASYLNVPFVCALTRCSAYNSDQCSYKEYLRQIEKNDGIHPYDPGLNFHLLRGAEFMRIANGWRMEDSLNEGNGILVVYDLKKIDDTFPFTKFGVQQKLLASY